MRKIVVYGKTGKPLKTGLPVIPKWRFFDPRNWGKILMADFFGKCCPDLMIILLEDRSFSCPLTPITPWSYHNPYLSISGTFYFEKSQKTAQKKTAKTRQKPRKITKNREWFFIRNYIVSALFKKNHPKRPRTHWDTSFQSSVPFGGTCHHIYINRVT